MWFSHLPRALTDDNMKGNGYNSCTNSVCIEFKRMKWIENLYKDYIQAIFIFL